MNKIKFTVNGFHCASCVNLVTRRIKKIHGVENVNIQDDGVSVIEANREIEIDEIAKAVESEGYTVSNK